MLLDFSDSDTRDIFSQALKNFSQSFTGNNLPPALQLSTTQGVLDNISSIAGAIGCFEYSTSLIASSDVSYINLKNAAGNVSRKIIFFIFILFDFLLGYSCPARLGYYYVCNE
jgi:hypothetical protein